MTHGVRLAKLPCVTGDPLKVNAKWYARFLRGVEVASVSYRDQTLRLRDRTDRVIASIPIDDIVSISVIRRVFSNELLVITKEQRWRCTALTKDKSRDLMQAVREYHRKRAAEPRARELAPQIENEDREVEVLLAHLISSTKYLRRSEVETHLAKIKQLIDQCDFYVRRSFSKETRAALQRLSDLDGDRIEQARRASNERYQRRVAAEPVARELRLQVEDACERVAHRLSGKKYLRRSAADAIIADIKRVIDQCDLYVRLCFNDETKAKLQRLSDFVSGRLEQARRTSNQQFVKHTVRLVAAANEDVLRVRLTEEQAMSVATDEDVTLLLAGAGTGKTAVITGKMAHLVLNQKAAPGEILVLAFNRKAVEEIRERLPSELRGVSVHTFHSFGRHVIAQSMDRKPAISKLAEDEPRRNAIGEIMHEMLASSRYRDLLVNLLAFYRNQYQSPFDFKSTEEYYRYVRSTERRTLSGVRVKSLEEVQVANLLSLRGVEFEYEKPYQVDTASAQYQQYRPDFYLPRENIYIEHFALDEEGNPPQHFRDYKEGVEWKRDIHKRHGTTMIETFSWQCRKGVLQSELEKNLRHFGVELSPVPITELLERLRQLQGNWLTDILASAIRHVKTNGVSPSELRRRAGESVRSNAFLDVFEKLLHRYERLLGNEDAVDFEDLINQAAEHIANGLWQVPYRYVLVDEFQDISAGRMALIAALKRAGIAYFLVGDDWQSINRFAGSDVGLVRDCGKYLGYVRECYLGTTFRYRAGILDPSAAFVQRNPEQTQRGLRTASTGPDHGITVVAEASQKAGIETALEHIHHREGAEPDGDGQRRVSVLALGRYWRSCADTVEVQRGEHLQVEFSTIHRAKGREDDYVLVLDLKNDQYGFPSQMEDDPLLELFLPSRRKRAFPHAEERRLFYVAITRARRGVYLIADNDQPSSFVEELMRKHPDIAAIGAGALARIDAPTCPRCGGRLVESQSGRNLRCVHHPLCGHLAPRCDACARGYIVIDSGRAVCTNDACATPPMLCPRCEAGILTRKSGPHGRFLGCSKYWAEPPCDYKEPIGA